MKSTLIFDKISKISLYLLVVLIPVWFLPVTTNILDYQKQALLLALVFGGMVSWLAKMVYEGGVVFRTSWLHIPVIGFLGIFGASTLFSSWQYGSFWGWPLHTVDNFLTFLALGLLYFFISQSVKDARHLFFLLTGFIISGTLAVIFALLQLKGVFLLPFEFAQAKNFNTVGTSNGVGAFAAVLLPLALMLASGAAKIWKGLLSGLAVLLFGSLVLIDSSSVWIALIAGLIILLAFDLRRTRSESKSQRISLPMVFLLVALFFLIVGDFSIPGAPDKQIEVAPTLRGELGIIKDMISEDPLSLLVGSGPGTFVFEHAKFRSSDMNQTLFWSMRFNSGTSEFFDWFITKGIAGAMILLVFIGVAIGVTVQMLMRQRQEQDHATQSLEIGLFVALLVGIGSLALYPASFMLWFVFWLLMGSLGFLARRSSRVLSFSSGHSFLALGSSLALLTILISVVSLLLVGGQKYYAEMMYFKGVNASRQGNVEEAITKISQAADLNPSVDIYWRGLAQLYVAKTNQLASDQTLPPDARQQEVGTTARKAIESAKRATERNPADVANWNVRGFVHRSLIGVPGEAEKAIESYKKAQELEPVSPFPWTELGRVKVLQAEILAGHGGSIEQRQQLIESALEDLKRAIELKRDYAPAHYLMAIAQDQQGNRQGAIAKLEETKLVAPNDIGLAFQLGVLYWRQNELGKALDEFERAKALNSRYSNVRYMLGLVYDALGRKEEAKTEFAIVSLLNPQNQEVKNILANLAAGLPALAGIGQPGTPPIQENPREIEQGE